MMLTYGLTATTALSLLMGLSRRITRRYVALCLIGVSSYTIFSNFQLLSYHSRFYSFDRVQYPLFTMMVFDEWRNGVPVAFVITAKSKQADLAPWMRALKH